MTAITLDDIKRDLPGYLERVRAGEVLLVTQAGKPVAEIKPVSGLVQEQRPIGLCSGDFVTPVDFDAPLPMDSLAEFEER